MLALTLTLWIGVAGIQLFRINERAFQEQNAASEIKQSTRATAFEIADEIRKSGSGVPSYAASSAGVIDEAAAIVLDGSDSTHLRLRTSLSNIETSVLTTPVEYITGVQQSINVTDASLFSTELGTTTPSGRFVYLWGSGANSCWGWVRAELTAIANGTNSVSLIPRQTAGCPGATAGSVSLSTRHTVVLEEAITLFLNSGSIWKATASDMTDPGNPAWGPSSELLRNVTTMSFSYYDEAGVVQNTNALAGRLAVARIDVAIEVRTSVVSGTSQTFGLVTRSFLRVSRTP